MKSDPSSSLEVKISSLTFNNVFYSDEDEDPATGHMVQKRWFKGVQLQAFRIKPANNCNHDSVKIKR